MEVPEGNGFGGSGYWVSRNQLFVNYSYQVNHTPQYVITDARRGDVLWQGKAEGFRETNTGQNAHAWCGGRLWQLDFKRRGETWCTTMSGAISDVQAHSGRLLVVTGQEIVALNPINGGDLWRWKAPSALKKVLLGYWQTP